MKTKKVLAILSEYGYWGIELVAPLEKLEALEVGLLELVFFLASHAPAVEHIGKPGAMGKLGNLQIIFRRCASVYNLSAEQDCDTALKGDIGVLW